MPRTTQDLTGRRFERLSVIERDWTRKGAAYWRVLCDCGTELSVTSQCLRTGHTRSCGCLKREIVIARSTKHGLLTREGRSPTYNSWHNMIARCTKPTHPRYADWGGRGITVCEQWRYYPHFVADMGEKPPGTTLGRIDNDGPYCPANCRWETHAKQARNTRRTKLTPQVILEIQRLYERRLPIGDIATELGIRRQTVGTVCIVLDALTTRPGAWPRRASDPAPPSGC
jgi:hypothetical protein